MHQPRVFVVILNTNRRDDTLECVRSLEAGCGLRPTIVLLDNASTDGTVEAVGSAHPGVRILPLSRNLGYAGNNNVGIEYALAHGADWVLLLNEDTVVDPVCLAELVAAGECDARIGFAGPMVYHHDEPDVIQSAGGELGPRWVSTHAGANEQDRGQFCAVRDVEWVSGCAILARREAIAGIGALDAAFFYYWEETEWCLRARRAGWRVVHVPGARVWHKGVQRDYRPDPAVSYYNTRNRLLMMKKHQAPPGVRGRAWFDIARTLASWTIRARWRGQREHRLAIWRGACDYLRGRTGRMPS